MSPKILFSGTRVAANALVGGTVSEITGSDNFGNGATSAALASIAREGVSKRGVKSKKKPNINGSDKVAYVGGAGDNNDTMHELGIAAPTVRDQYEAYVAANGADSAQYFEWNQRDELSTFVADNGGRVTVVAHSYGADTAAELVAGGMQVHKLVTVDPVGWTRPDMSAVANNAVIWNNYDSSGSMWSHPSNFVGAIGGAWNSRPNGYATQHIPSPKNHVDICTAYCRPEL